MVLTLPGSTGSVTVTAIVADLDTVTFTATASPVAGQLVFRYVEVGSYHACAITTAEESLCWGFNENGQVSDAAASPLAMTRSPGAATVRMTSAGRYHSCEVTLAGDVNCFGSNSQGQAAPGAPPPSKIKPLVDRQGRFHAVEPAELTRAEATTVRFLESPAGLRTLLHVVEQNPHKFRRLLGG